MRIVRLDLQRSSMVGDRLVVGFQLDVGDAAIVQGGNDDTRRQLPTGVDNRRAGGDRPLGIGSGAVALCRGLRRGAAARGQADDRCDQRNRPPEHDFLPFTPMHLLPEERIGFKAGRCNH
jgi:hypothetical protein